MPGLYFMRSVRVLGKRLRSVQNHAQLFVRNKCIVFCMNGTVTLRSVDRRTVAIRSVNPNFP